MRFRPALSVTLAIALAPALTVALPPPAWSADGARPARTKPPRSTATPRYPPPALVAHRGGTADAPENTLPAIQSALRHGVEAVWLSVQLSADGVPVLYRPADLSMLTEGRGPVAQSPVADLQRLNAGWNFRTPDGRFPYRQAPVRIPTLAEALAATGRVPLMLDLKTTPSQALVDAIAGVLTRARAWPRVLLYSTEAGFAPLWSAYRQARQFETRDLTRGRLLGVALAQRCDAPPRSHGWAAFELRRNVEVTERFTLGEGRNAIQAAQLWTPAAVDCFRRHVPDYGLLVIGIDSEADYRQAWQAGASAVMVNSPRQARQWRDAALRRPPPAHPRLAPPTAPATR